MPSRRTYEVLADVFHNEAVKHCFALLGDANMNWAAALATRGCEFTYVRDEHCAVAAAMSWSRCTGAVGVASVTCGPGVTQIMTALPAAVRASIPLIIFAGESPLSKAWYNQQIDQKPLVEACGAEYVALHHVPSMARQIRDAFVLAKSKRTPVVIGVPFDLQETEWLGDNDLPPPSRSLLAASQPVSPSAEDVRQACELISEAKRVVIMAGLGAIESGAIDVCKQLASYRGALLATSLPARGAFHDDEFCIGIAGGFSTDVARKCLQEADLIIAVGCSLTQHNADSGKLFSAEKVLQIDINPQSISQSRVAAKHHLKGDAKLSIESIMAQLSSSVSIENDLCSWRTASLANEIKTTPADSAEFEIEAGMLDPRRVVGQLNAVLPTSWFMVNSSGHCSYFSAQMPGRPAEKFLTIREFGAIGNGIAFAIGAAVANPNTPVVLFDGDGSFLMHVQELETIRRHKLNILICILNDGAYGSEIHKLRAEGLSDKGALFGYDDLSRIARGFDVEGTAVKDLAELASMVNDFNQCSGAAVWDFHVSDKVVSPVIRRSHS